VILLLAALDVATLRSTASAKTDFDVTNATINAGADYVVYFNGAFPNWTPGLVGSYIPLAHSHIDNSPFAEGTASPADTGPVGQTAFATGLSTTQPQYAEQKYPPGATKPATVGSQGGPYAEASANASQAKSLASAGGNTASGSGQSTGAQAGALAAPSARSASIAAFNAAFSAWRARFLTAGAAGAHPQVAASDSNPDGTDGDTASSSVTVDPAQGLIATGDSRVQQASFGGGALAFHNVHVAVSIVNAGTPKATTTVNIGDSTVGGMPVSIGKDGVTVGPNTVPIDLVQQANQQLNAILAAAGLTVTQVAPEVKTSTNQETITATGIRVTENQPGPPQQTVHHVLGNVFADNLAVPSAAAVSLGGLGAGSLSNGSPAGSSYLPGTEGSPGTLGSAGSPANTTPGTAASAPAGNGSPPAALASSMVKNKPLWLLLLYFMWQSLLVGSLISIWWWRHGAAMAKAAAT
jgi:hypothetical protein